jgi:hypothetical protein
MIQRVKEQVSVQFLYDHKRQKILPRAILWKGRIHVIRQVALHHRVREGRTVFHIFSVSSDTLDFRLSCDTDTLHWTLQEISDGVSA